MNTIKPQRLRTGWLVGLALAVTVGAVSSGYLALQGKGSNSFLASPELANARLFDVSGREFDMSSLEGRPVAVFFGFTQCPDVCPMTLQRLALMKQAIGKPFDKIQVVFVTLDPDQDKAAALASYLKNQPLPVIGLTGTMADVSRAAVQFGVFHERVALGSDSYTIDHTATLFLFDREGRRAGEIPFDATQEEFEAKLRSIL